MPPKTKGSGRRGIARKSPTPPTPPPAPTTPEATGEATREVAGDLIHNDENSETELTREVETEVVPNEDVLVEAEDEDSSQTDTQDDVAPEEKRPKKSRGEPCLLTPQQEVDIVS